MLGSRTSWTSFSPPLPPKVEMRSLGIIIPAKLPLIGRHFRDIGVESTLFSTDWFLCLFCTSTPSETAAR